MKKSIKYAGIAAATLLAVAPVAAPVVSSTTAQAAIKDDVNTPASELKTAKDKFAGQFADKDVSTDANYANLTLGETNAVDTTKFNENNADVISDALSNTDAAKYLTLLDGKNAKAYLTAEDASGYTYDGTPNHTVDNLVQAIKADDSMLPITFTVHLKDVDVNGVGSEYKTVASFKLNKSDEGTELTSINAKFNTPVTVAKNSKTALTRLVSSTNLALTDQDGEAVSTVSTTIGNGFYKTYTAAIDAAVSSDAALAKDDLGDDIKDGEFKTAGTYYQLVNFKAGEDTQLADFLENYNDDPSSYTVFVNGKAASEGNDFYSTGDTISFVRTIKVSNDESQWTVTDNKGVVTTKSDTPYYTLVNDNNEKIANRALAKNSAWITDQKRVDQNGNTQYRVATGEWIDANNVTFSDKATTDEGAYTDEQALNGKVTLDGPSSFVYFLYNDNGEQISSRALGGDSAWFTDKKATNAAGVTVYHVATGEWVQAGSGVNYSAY